MVNEWARDLWQMAYSGALFPLQERLKGHYPRRVLRELEASQWREPAELENGRVARLRALLVSANERVPYYHECFREYHFDPNTITDINDLRGLPLLDKATIRARFDDLRATDARRLRRLATGGSSGEPLIFMLGPERVTHDIAAKWRATRWWNVDIGDPEVVLWGSPVELGAQDHVRALRDWLQRSWLLPAFEMSHERLAEYVDCIRRRCPRMLFGYPSAISQVARFAEEQGQGLDDVGIRVAFVTGERLYNEQREGIERVFGCNVANGYGGRDAGFVAHECPEGRMHVTAEDVIVEIVDVEGYPVPKGDSGEIVVTHLASRDFPFVRYRTGDVGTLSNEVCPCGRGLPVLAEVSGRATDFVMARDGTMMHGLALIYVMRELPDVQAFRIVQESLDRTRVQVVSERALGATAERIREGFRKRLGAEVEISVEQVDRIPAEPSGKYRYVQSHVCA